MAWRALPPGIYRGTIQPTISIQKSGALTWNRGAQQALGEPEVVQILFDEERKLLGLRKVDGESEGFRVRRLGNQNTWITSARGALRRVGLLPSRAYRRVAELQEGVLAIDVSELLAQAGR